MATFNFDMHLIGQTLARLKAGMNIGDLLPFVSESLITRLAEAASTND